MKHWQKILVLVVAITLIAAVLGAGFVGPKETASTMHPALAQLAVENPEQRVSVIVQTAADAAELEGLIRSLGGVVTRDLHIIRAVGAELPAGAMPELARAPGVRWISLDAPVTTAGKPQKNPPPDDGSTTDGSGGLVQAYNQVFLDTMNVRQVWDMGYQGEGITVAVIDSGIVKEKDFDVKVRGGSSSRVLRQLSFNPSSATVNDVYGHGTHVAGIVAGNGKDSRGEVSGVAPLASVISLKISDEQGMAFEADTVEAMQWVLDNKDMYNIRVVNLSIHSPQVQSYHHSPIDAAAEILWFNGIVVVASAGNEGSGAIDSAPANDPFLITVGASDELQTADPTDDIVATYSAFGTTMDGHVKPDVVAPGQDIVSLLSDSSDWGYLYPERLAINGEYFRLSGTSMSAPMVAGAAVLLLDAQPDLTPDQLKYRLMNAGGIIQGVDGDPRSYPYLDVLAAVTSTSTESANTGLAASQLLWTGDEPLSWDSVNWNSVNWNSVNWNSVNWNSVNWNSVNWNSVAWDK